MKCPKCHNEVGTQSVCPFCGATVYIQGLDRGAQGYRQHTFGGEPQSPNQYVSNFRDVDRRLYNLQMKINLLLILQCAIFVLVVLAVVVLALK